MFDKEFLIAIFNFLVIYFFNDFIQFGFYLFSIVRHDVKKNSVQCGYIFTLYYFWLRDFCFQVQEKFDPILWECSRKVFIENSVFYPYNKWKVHVV